MGDSSARQRFLKVSAVRAALWCCIALLPACAHPRTGDQLGPFDRGTRGPRAARPASGATIDTLELRAHAYFLAHDQLAGRATGTPGADQAALYIAAQCRRLGLAPLAGNYYQPVPLAGVLIEGGSLVVDSNDRRPLGEERQGRQFWRQQFQFPQHFLPDLGTAGASAGFSGPVVYVNTPIVPEALPELAGAVAATSGSAGEREALAALADRGAVGVLQLGADPELFTLYLRSRGVVRLYHADRGMVSSLLPPLPVVIAGPDLTRALLDGTPLAGGQPMASGPLGRRVTLGLETRRRAVDARNVGCLLPGTDRRARDTAIVFTAHYDHLGVGLPDERGDSIYNGFSDNAAGVAMLLSLAKTMRQTPPPLRHTVLFLFFTGEEHGLLGSDYYVAHPLWPLARTRAVINLDAGAPPAPPSSWRLAGGERTPLGLLAVDVALEHGWSATTSPPRPNSDYYPFARLGVPAISVIPGPGAYERLSMDSSEALRRRWDFYHRPGDEWSVEFPFAGLRRYAEYAYLIALAVDGREASPNRRGVRRRA